MSSKAKAPPRSRVAGRRPVQTVDTDLNSYDRTDPWAAFHVLHRLLSSLPSRVGGCQYKLTPDEHKLSMHLLTIVEPFVGISSARRTLDRQPTEVLDAIAAHLDAKRDVLALGLTCQRMRDVVFPRHFDYRVVRCKVSSIRVWNHLHVNRALARNVRRLEILDERAGALEMIPRGIRTSDTDLESTDDELGMHAKQERFLISALAQMTSIQTFVWSCNHCPLSMSDIWPILLKCPSLKEVRICDNLLFNASQDSENADDKRLSVLPELRTAVFRATAHTYGATKTPNLVKIGSVLNQCPRLESLDISYVSPRGPGYMLPVGDSLMTCGRWPQLRNLTLTNIRCSSAHGFEAASTFLFAHTGLEVLHLDISFSNVPGGKPRLILLPNSLPHLRELRTSKELIESVLVCPSDEPRPLEIIKGVKLSGAADAMLLRVLKKFGGGLKRLEMSGWTDMEDVKMLADCVPNLTWLDIGKKMAPPAAGRSIRANLSANANAAEWAAILCNLPELTTFHGAKFFYEVSAEQHPLGVSDRSRVRKNDEIASVLAWKCPKLRRVDHWDENSGKVIVLSKDGDKVRWEGRRMRVAGSV
ncbi:hypothetical protein OE88DRAFT_1666587 [Heliocybe sulcata]|uniref:F-box domain-containing protein n=1 Tax=Heliocybe sulcata TaxID=5364 RepID=A0A5C3N0E7_9AGAM|nr:hypothetical protein OE88DRAFT_1666587 [Heliocybe sulcata]